MTTKMITYNKLVRDKIPQIIENDPTVVGMRVTSHYTDDDFKLLLSSKLIEEAEEYFESGDIEELADVYEVLATLATLHYDSPLQFRALEKLEEVCVQKNEARGGFENRTYLHYVVKEVAEDE